MNVWMRSMGQITNQSLLDTTVFIDYLRGKNPASVQIVSDVLNDRLEAGFSIITDMELWVGVRNNAEARKIKILLAKFRRYQFSVVIARRVGDLRRINKSWQIPDLIIAATAEYYKVDIITRNIDHFTPLPIIGIKIVGY